MAPAAVGTELSVVDIVTCMTVAAATAELCLRFQFLSVTGFAADGLVGSVQNERCLGVVIKTPPGPVDWRMTQTAIIRETIVMWIVVHMAGTAVLRRITEDLRLMAGRAFGIRMFAEQRELSQVVIKEDIVPPRNVVMAVTAHFSLCTAVRVVIFVALAATRQRLGIEDGFDVTVRTLN
jgi:hypothetical protein